MLQEIQSQASASGVRTPDKQICVYATTSNQIMYEVPESRVFKGYVVANSTSTGIRINNGYLYLGAGSYGTYQKVPLELVAGTVIRSTDSGVSLLGVERDA